MTEQINKQGSNIPSQTENLVEMYLGQLDAKPTTISSYRKSLGTFMSWLNDNNIDEVDKGTLLDYKRFLVKRYKANTVNAYIVALKSFYSFLEEHRISRNHTTGLKGVKASKNFSKSSLTIEQALELLRSFDRNTLEGKRNYALISLMINTGLRVMEVHGADIDDIDQTSGHALLYIQGKGRDSKDNYVVLEHNVLEALNDYINSRGDNEGALFKGISNRSNNRLTKGSISRIVKTSFRNIGLDNPKLTAHSTRHTAVTFSLLGGATIQEAQAMARHSNINTTMIYSHNINRIQNNAESKIANILSGS